MMRLIVIAILWAALTATGQTLNPGRSFYVAGLLKPAAAASGDPCTGCTNELFNTAVGYDVAGWNESGVIENEDYTTSPAPLEGTQSLLCRNTGFDSAFTYLNLPSGADGEMRFRFLLTNTVVNGLTIATFSDNLSSHNARVRITSGKLEIAMGATVASTADSLAANTAYYCWVNAHAGTGSATMTVEFSTSKIRTDTGNKYVSISGATCANFQQYAIGAADLAFGGPFGGVIFDQVSFRASSSRIGDFP